MPLEAPDRAHRSAQLAALLALLALTIAAGLTGPRMKQVSLAFNLESMIQNSLARRIAPLTLQDLADRHYLLEIPLDPATAPDWNRIVFPGVVIDDRIHIDDFSRPGIDLPSGPGRSRPDGRPYAYW